MTRAEADELVKQCNLLIEHINKYSEELYESSGNMGTILGTMLSIITRAGYRLVSDEKGIYIVGEGDTDAKLFK